MRHDSNKLLITRIRLNLGVKTTSEFLKNTVADHALADMLLLREATDAPRTTHLWTHVSHGRGGGASRDRTDDLLLAKQALSQLSYGPVLIDQDWWVWEELNLRPHPYQGCALTN